MKKILLVRPNSFEVNSSSSHTVCISNKKGYTIDSSWLPDSNGNLEISQGDYGWEFTKFNDSKEKARYALTSFRRSDEMIELLKKVIEDTLQGNLITDPKQGGIDHESDGCVTCDYDTLKKFIFNPKSIVFTGNDNEQEPYNLKDSLKKNYSFKLQVYHIFLSEKNTPINFFEREPYFESIPDEKNIRKAMNTIVGKISEDEYGYGSKYHFLSYYPYLIKNSHFIYFKSSYIDYLRANHPNLRIWDRALSILENAFDNNELDKFVAFKFSLIPVDKEESEEAKRRYLRSVYYQNFG